MVEIDKNMSIVPVRLKLSLLYLTCLWSSLWRLKTPFVFDLKEKMTTQRKSYDWKVYLIE